jgi:hypothetical protein
VPWTPTRGFEVNVYASDPSRIGSAESVAAAVNWSAEKEAVCKRRPLGVVKSRRSDVQLLGREILLLEVSVRLE